VAAAGGQVAILAPTAVLAAQHQAFIAARLAGTPWRSVLVTGGMGAAERTAALADLAAGRTQIAIGTHALLGDEVRFADLRLAVVDEQHRFGVDQRAALAQKAPPGRRAHLLVLTATPIPRTLALTAWGDLAVSRIAGRPPGRAAVTTEVAPFPGWPGLRAALHAADGQAFVVCARTDEAADQAAPLAVGAAARAARAALGEAAVAVLTGDQPEADKLAALADLAAGRIRCLVATTVVEVGIDLPDATLMVVLDAERFGLSTLHQLRGRIGRGTRSGRCLLWHRGEAGGRLALLAATDDGLAIAEADLVERGPGALLGDRQYGAADGFAAAELPADLDLLQDAHAAVRAAAQTGAAMPPGLGRFLAPGAPARLLAG
jgi:ATP-dependent DNA helicase RecG